MFQLEEQCDVSYWKEDAPVTREALVEGVKVMMVVVVFFADVSGGDVGAWQSHHLEFFLSYVTTLQLHIHNFLKL